MIRLARVACGGETCGPGHDQSADVSHVRKITSSGHGDISGDPRHVRRGALRPRPTRDGAPLAATQLAQSGTRYSSAAVG